MPEDRCTISKSNAIVEDDERVVMSGRRRRSATHPGCGCSSSNALCAVLNSKRSGKIKGKWEMGNKEDKVGTNETQHFNIVKKANQQERLKESKVVYSR